MKTAFSTVACMGASWREVLHWAHQAGMDAVEIRLNEDGSVFGLAEEDLKTMLRAFQAAGVAISDLGSSIRFSDYDESAVAHAKKCIQLAEKTGARGIRVFPGSFVRRFSSPAPHNLDGMARFLQETAAEAKKRQVEIWIETHNEFSTGESMRRLLEKADRTNVKVIWDLIHPYEYGERPEDTLAMLSGAVAHVHVKDGRKATDPDQIDYDYTKLGGGELPLQAMIGLLEKKGYAGYYSLEWENAWRPEIRNLYQTMDALLTDWNAFLSSIGGENHE